MATALALRERGHDVAVRTEAASVGLVEKLGLGAAPVDPRIEEIDLEDWKARTPIGALKTALEAFDRASRYEAPDLRKAIAAERPDLLWIDVNTPGAAAAAEASGLPWGTFMPFPAPWPSRGVPSFGPGFAPSSSRLAAVRDAGLERIKGHAFRDYVRSQNELRESLGLPALRHAEDFYMAAPLLMLFSAEPFEYPREWPPSVRLVGPALWEPEAAEPEWLAAEERPIVLVTASTVFQDDSKLIRCALEAFAGQPYLVVATTAAHDPDEFDAPANAVVARRLPHAPIVRRAAAVISHGGMGTTQKALAAGVPVCVVPFFRDQLEVGRRAEHCGGGTLLPSRRLRPDRLRAAVQEAIARRPGAKRVADAFARAGGEQTAASALEGLMSGDTQPTDA